MVREPATRLDAVSLLLAGAMCALPFLVPYHQLPVLSFYPEWLAAALGVCAALAGLVGRRAVASIPVPALWVLAFGLYLLVRALAPGEPYPQISLLAALYVLFAALMIWLGSQLVGAFGVERVALVLSGFLLAGALANSLAGAIQFYGRPVWLEDAVARLSGTRAYGNIAQPNLYANYLVLGQCALMLLWLRRRIPTGLAVPIVFFLAACSALSGSRSTLVFAAWIALFAALGGRVRPDEDSGRLRVAAYCVAGAAIAAYLAVPWLNDALRLGPSDAGTMHGLQMPSGEFAEPRWRIYALALRIVGEAPVFGVGAGGFPGAAFQAGLDPSLTRIGEVLTSPHDLPLHLLAETGVVGTVLVFAALWSWGRRAARLYLSDPQPALWWVGAATGVELIHSLVEFPLWSANFLGVTALLMGVSAAPGTRREASAPVRIAAAAPCAVLIVALAILLRDYIRLDTARITGTSVTLAAPAVAERDVATMRALARGPLAPVVELWILSGASLDRTDLAAKLAMSERVMRYWPANDVLVRRVALLALHGDAERARALLERVLQIFPQRREAAATILQMASSADVEALRPLVLVARGTAK